MNAGKENPEEKKNNPSTTPTYEVTAEGSLGILALGDRGIKAWREKREEEKLKTTKNKTNE